MVVLLYRHMYSTTRIPKKEMDDVQVWKGQKHVVVFRKGVYFKLDVYKKDSEGFEVQVTIPELYAQLQQIIEMAEGRYMRAAASENIHVYPAKIQISLCIFCTFEHSDQNLHWVHFGYPRMQRIIMWTTKTDQTAQI